MKALFYPDYGKYSSIQFITLYGATVDHSEGRYLGVELQFVRDDEVAVESERHRGWVGIPAARVDCYASTQVVLLAADGSVRSRYVTTAEGC